MAKINIILNNKTYSIDESVLESATNDLKSHFSTTMSGSGATINLGGTTYNIDSTKLTAATNDFVSHLGTISGSGSSVTVNGVNYGVDSTKLQGAMSKLENALGTLSGGSTPDAPTEERLEGDGAEYYTLAPTALSFRSTAPLSELQEVQINGVTVDPTNYTLEEGSTIVTFPIDYLKTLNVGSYEVNIASESKSVKGNFSVKAPELNEHGFYYNQPYTAFVTPFRSETAFFLREGGVIDIVLIRFGNIETASYSINGTDIVVNSSSGTFTGTFSDDGKSVYVNELAVTFALGNELIVADDDYIYTYNEDLGGYEVAAIDKMKASYGAIKTGLNGYNTVKLADNMFVEDYDNILFNNNMTAAPLIPDGVTSIGHRAFYHCSNLTNITIPDSVTFIDWGAFGVCDSLANITIPNGVTYIHEDTFRSCLGLTEVNIPNGVTGIGSHAFYSCYGLNSITIPDGVSSIGINAFGACENLASVRIGKGVIRIDALAFSYCTNLTSITFDGTTAQWNAISKKDGWNSGVPATHVQCSDGQVAL